MIESDTEEQSSPLGIKNEPTQLDPDAAKPLWFDLRRVFLNMKSLCEEARIREEQAAEEANMIDPISQSMGALQSPGADRSEHQGADIVLLREALRRRFGWLKNRLSSQLTERETYYALFPLVVYMDEIVQLKLPRSSHSWHPLQQELYKLDNGGELFYQAIDTLMAKPDTPPIIFEVFFFCLADGFRGRYADSLDKIRLYRSIVSQRIPTRALFTPIQESSKATTRIELIPFPKWTYAVAFGAVCLGFTLAHLASYLELRF
ncbi:MAG: DotU family type IV/VI secretion system protein [Myxococcota bacterium]|nr:DotU family type IV/VI secretion system protein [Myxococcota bacterium]